MLLHFYYINKGFYRGFFIFLIYYILRGVLTIMEQLFQFLQFRGYTLILSICYILFISLLSRKTKFFLPSVFYGLFSQLIFMIYFIKTGISLMQSNKYIGLVSFNQFLFVIELFWVVFMFPIVGLIFYRIVSSDEFKRLHLVYKVLNLIFWLVVIGLFFFIGGAIYIFLYYGFAP